VAVCGPPTLLPVGIEQLGVRVFRRVEEAIEWADVLNVLRLQLERMQAGYVPACASTTASSASPRRASNRRPRS
jgi:aspartate carbamoyltransferase catalytic subunit